MREMERDLTTQEQGRETRLKMRRRGDKLTKREVKEEREQE